MNNTPTPAKQKIKPKHKLLLLKIALALTVGSSAIISGSMLYLFINLDNYTSQIKQMVKDKSAYQLEFSSLKTGFDNHGAPYLNLNNISLKDKLRSQPFIQIKQISLILSYRSLFQFQPIFKLISIDGSQLNFEFDKNNNLLLNKQVLTNLKTSTPPEIDWEYHLLAQRNIMLNNFNISLTDSKHHMDAFTINKLKLQLINGQDNEHNLAIQANPANGKMAMSLNFTGSKLTDYHDWNYGQLQIYSIGHKGYQVKLNAKVTDGSIRNINTIFDSNQQHVSQLTGSKTKSISDFSGEIKLNRVAPHKYQLHASDLMTKTPYGYLFKHASIDGYFTLDSGGRLEIKNVGLEGINSLIKLSKFSNKLKVHGDLKTIHFDWHGTIYKPHGLNFITDFEQIGLDSKESNIPSFNHLSGRIIAGESSGTLSLKLKDTTLDYPKNLWQPLNIQNLITLIHWDHESQNHLRVSLPTLAYQGSGINFSANATYIPIESSLKAQIKLTKLDINQIYKLLPKSVDKSSVAYIKQNFTTGGFYDTTITMNGNPAKLPFESGGGTLSIDSKFNHVSYQFQPKWNGLTNIRGTIKGRNQAVNANIVGADLEQIHLGKTNLDLADILAKKFILNIQGFLTGNSEDFLAYLISSPYESQIEPISRKIKLSGQSQINFKASLPLETPEKLKLTGQYITHNNQLSFATESPLNIEEINGSLNFTQNGLAKSQLNARGLNSELQLNIHNSNELELNASNLDYSYLVNTFYPQLNQIISGHAASNAKFNLKSQSLVLSSDLQGISLNAPAPIAKKESEISKLQISVNLGSDNSLIGVNYANNIFAKAQLGKDYNLEYLNLGIGTNNYMMSDESVKAPITIKAQLDNVYTEQWAQFISKLTAANEKTNTESILTSVNESENALVEESNTILSEIESSPQSPDNGESEDEQLYAKSPLFPIQVEVNSNAFWIKNYNLDQGKANFLIFPSQIFARIDTPDISGDINYLLDENKLYLNFQRLLFSTENFKPEQTAQESKLESAVNNESAPIVAELETGYVPNLPITYVNIEELYLQNHYSGNLTGTVYQQNDSLFLENMKLTNKSATTLLNLTSHCLGCSESDAYVALNIHSDIDNFGLFLIKLDQGGVYRNGNGTLDLGLSWPGGLTDFKRKSLVGRANLNIQNGELLQLNPGLFGALMGVINLSAINISNLNHFNFNTLFGKGFAVKNLDTNLYLNQDDLKIENLDLHGEVADVSTFGNYYLESNTIDTYLTVTPRLSGTIATTAGIVTLNPFIGAFIYLGEKLIGDPINKALAISYHVQGNVESPTMTQTKISNQVLKNFKSSFDFLKPLQ
ncbi:MAG: AsmA-like C-terminal domain-containing protein [Burkholderiales bacterium]|nr:AsmA-like C-terminal domain-containing protein [Burkholderiales bacterium]